MASNIVEFFGYSPKDQSSEAKDARAALRCPFLGRTCVKTLSDGTISGVCTLKPMTSGPVICCPIRLYSSDYRILQDVAAQAFGGSIRLVIGSDVASFRTNNPGRNRIAVFGKRWGKELRLPSRAKKAGGKIGAYFVDWILAHVDAGGNLLGFVAVEVQSIDTTGNYQAERLAYLETGTFEGKSTAGLNWENVNKRILPQIIYKGHVLRREPLCQKGLFFVGPTPVYNKIAERLGGTLTEIHQQAGSVTIMWYDVGPPVPEGQMRALELCGQSTTTSRACLHRAQQSASGDGIRAGHQSGAMTPWVAARTCAASAAETQRKKYSRWVRDVSDQHRRPAREPKYQKRSLRIIAQKMLMSFFTGTADRVVNDTGGQGFAGAVDEQPVFPDHATSL